MSIELKEIIKEEGVSDLPFGQKVKFARALKAERLGNSAEAETHLNEAITAQN